MTRVASGAPADLLWAGMARESAHELRSPLSSVAGWIDLLEARGQHDGEVLAMAAHMRADLDRMDRVAQRVERIAGGLAREAVGPAAVVDRVAGYFRARVPALAHAFVIAVEPTRGDPQAGTDAVLLEWVVELLVQDALDTLAGTGGRITLSVAAKGDGTCRIRVAAEAPGAREHGSHSAVGPAWSPEGNVELAQRIVEGHGMGRLLSAETDQSRAFDVIIT